MQKSLKIIAYTVSVVFICACGSAGNVKSQEVVKRSPQASKKSVERKYHRRKIPGVRASVMEAVARVKPMVLGYDKKLGYLGKRYDEAITYIQGQKRAYPNLNGSEMSALNSYLGQANFGLKNYEEAINVYQETLSYSPRLPTSHESISYLGIAKAYLKLDNIAAAKKTLNEYELAISDYNSKGPRRIWQKSSGFKLVKAEIALYEHEYEKAISVYEEILCLTGCDGFKSFYDSNEYKNLKRAYERDETENKRQKIEQLNAILEKKNIKPQILYRFKARPIILPPNAPKSGSCRLRFDLNERGKAQNVSIVECSDSYFEHFSLKTVEGMVYEPSFDESGKAIVTRGVFHEVKY